MILKRHIALNTLDVLEGHIGLPWKAPCPRVSLTLPPRSLQVSRALEVCAAAPGLLGRLRCVLGVRNPRDPRSGHRDPWQWVSSVVSIHTIGLIFGERGFLFMETDENWVENRFLGEMKTKNMSGPALCTWAFLSVCKHFKATEEWQEQHSEPRLPHLDPRPCL